MINFQGLGLFLLAMIINLIFIIIYPFIGKKLLSIRWTWIAIGLITFIYYFSLRVIPNFIELWHPINMYNGVSQDDPSAGNIRLSNVLMLDACPMIAFLMPLLCIFEKKRRVLTFIAPIALLGGVASLCCQMLPDWEGGWPVNNPYGDGYIAHFTWEYIFLGNEQDHLFFMMHFFMVVLATITLISTDRKIWINIVGSLCWTICMAVYAAIFAYSLDVKIHAFGTVVADWTPPDGEFSMATDIVGSVGWGICVFLVILSAVVIIIMLSFYFLRRMKIKTFNKRKEISSFQPFGLPEHVYINKTECKEILLKSYKEI